MDKPRIEGALGLAWRPRKNGWAAVWLARQDIARDGYKPATRQISVHTSPLTEQDEIAITAKCLSFQDDMIRWNTRHDAPKVFGGDLRSLVNVFQTDKDSPFHGWEYDGRMDFINHCKHIARDDGHLKLADIGARDFKRIYEEARWRGGSQEERGKVNYAHKRISALRAIFSFGMAFEIDPNCARVKAILAEMKFENGRARTESMTLRQCEDIIAAAHQFGFPSIALAQAIQFDWRVRQRDVIGAWVPERERGITVTHWHGRKWLRGMRHEEISSTLVISHPVSKSRHHGKMLERDINLYPMVKTEFDRIPEDKRHGPLVVCEITGRPWRAEHFRDKWRDCATLAKVPENVWNMDSRSGGITETIEATGGNIEAARKEAGHSDQKQTARYSRRANESNTETAVIVADFRKNRA